MRLARFAWGVVAYNVAVILWGAYVRATGSGAGCGAHWPLCDGAIVPRAPTVEMIVEYSHRLTSGIALISVIVLLVWIRRAFAAGHPARRGATLSLLFMLTEAAVGAGVALELNSQPLRLDLTDTMARAAQAAGALLAIDTDAHSVGQLELIRYGVSQARRGWVEAHSVVNTWTWAKLSRWLATRRRRELKAA